MAIERTNVVEPRETKVLESDLVRSAYKLLAMGYDPNSSVFKSMYGQLNLRVR